MYRHVIAYSVYPGGAYAYHFATADLKGTATSKAIARLGQHERDADHHYGLHVFNTEAASFASVQAMDPYFEGCLEITDLDEFFDFYRRVHTPQSQQG
ncbi:hypothetical protein [Levilactobacillus yiduensis]|uniref:hypothetical protein n=1 Tax=Levilactobacillus yiduensis TaxID=2953880 RepID=UPI0021575477|nr:hypothetical protein [Levilactobacillus yiduensis]